MVPQFPWVVEIDGEQVFGCEKVSDAKNLVCPFSKDDEMWEALDQLRKKVREFFGFKETKRWNLPLSGAYRYVDVEGSALIVSVLEFVDEDGLGYLVRYEISKNKVRFVEAKVLAPVWWVE